MLLELRVRDLGVIADLDLVIATGMTALTGETGAGKTLVVEALDLLLGGRADAAMVRSGASEASVEGRFVLGEQERVLSRSIPTSGRSRAYVDGRMAPASMLAELGDDLVDLHGQHAHQSLLRQAAQRDALDAYGDCDLEPLARARQELAGIDARLLELGGDPRELARAVDLLRFQVEEISRARITSANEDERLSAEEAGLSEVESIRSAVADARASLTGPDASSGQTGAGALDLLGTAMAQLSQHESLSDLAGRLRVAQADVDDVSHELRLRGESLVDDPRRLQEVRERLQLFAELRRKYGPRLAEVIEFESQAQARLATLGSAEKARTELEQERNAALDRVRAASERLGRERRDAAPKLASAIEAHLHELALAGARLEVRIGDEVSGSDVEFLLGANPGEPALALSKVASGGELARAMLATRLVLSAAPPTLVFDEVDAGVGGEAALAVGRALAAIARDHQVLVVTHLAQVAAFADQQLVVSKSDEGGRTVARVRPVVGEDRLVELSRMLSGHPGSAAARKHAKELLALAARSVTASGRSGSLE